MSQIIIDVREKDEFEAEHIENAIHLPLSTFEGQAPAVLRALKDKPLTFVCVAGKRASMAATQAAGFGLDLKCEVYPGGIEEWKKQGKPTIAAKSSHLPIMRQVQLIAGSLALTGALLAHFVNPNFIILSGFVGAGLTVAGATGFCGMAELLSRLPWNKNVQRS